MDVCGSENFIAVKEAYVCTVCGIETGIDNKIYCDLQLYISEDVKQNEGIKDAEELNQKLKQNSMYADWHVHIVLVKEVLVEVLSGTKTMARSELRQLCTNTEFSCTEAIREEIRTIREAKQSEKKSGQYVKQSNQRRNQDNT
ncbi:Hypothetical predicted protein [Mytilus galloprovincialis]|uniref:Uncharacterized protein n=1 Tax=Mytilus galloprovincialis TaxID=29158 RepID=A0A8B6FVP3_MYTGA|nr:Hypothetical predicted protein [Mytilus galloprovincialis]